MLFCLFQYMMNHFLDRNVTLLGITVPVPATSELVATNDDTGTGSLGEQADTCFSSWGYYPTFTLVDFYDVGNGSVFGAFISLKICVKPRMTNELPLVSFCRVPSGSQWCVVHCRHHRQRYF